MAKLTTRDRIWSETLKLAEENRSDDGFNSSFDADDVLDRLEDPPSKRTVRDALDSMADLGHLNRRWRGYEPIEKFEDTQEQPA